MTHFFWLDSVVWDNEIVGPSRWNITCCENLNKTRHFLQKGNYITN